MLNECDVLEKKKKVGEKRVRHVLIGSRPTLFSFL